jgi:hypothetical protein
MCAWSDDGANRAVEDERGRETWRVVLGLKRQKDSARGLDLEGVLIDEVISIGALASFPLRFGHGLAFCAACCFWEKL